MAYFESFTNYQCEYFPCHQIDENDYNNFNCLFCFCPLYHLDCKGDYTILDNGIKDCSNCLIPHFNRDYILQKLSNKT